MGQVQSGNKLTTLTHVQKVESGKPVTAQTKNANFTILSTDSGNVYICSASANVVATLPAAVPDFTVTLIHASATYTLTITPLSTEYLTSQAGVKGTAGQTGVSAASGGTYKRIVLNCYETGIWSITSATTITLT